MFKQLRGQTVLEYALLLAAVVAGLVMMQIYAKRGLQGKYKIYGDNLGSQYSPGRVTDSTIATVTLSNSSESSNNGLTTVTSSETKSVNNNETVAREQM